MKPGSGFCDLCTQLKALGTPPALELLRVHKEQVMVEKLLYRENVRQCAAEDCHVACVQFDFAQAVLLLHSVNQQNCYYFMTGLKASIFGIGEESRRSQTNFIIEEGNPQPKAAAKNQVMSSLYNYLVNSSKMDDMTELILCADNCAAQNKNQWMIKFLCWLGISIQ
jgi:hypothetical protein